MAADRGQWKRKNGGQEAEFGLTLKNCTLLINQCPDAVMIIELDGTAVFVNEETGRRLGKTPSELTGKNIFDFLPPDVAEFRRRKLADMVRTQKPLHFRDESGGRIVNSLLYPLTDESESVYRAAVIGRDVSDQTLAMESLRVEETKYRTLVNGVSEMLFLHDLEGRIVEVNDAACRVTGYSRDELQSMRVRDLDPDADPRDDARRIWRSLETGRHMSFMVRHRRKDGSEYPAEVHVNKVDLQGKPFLLGLASDISGRAAAEQALENSRREMATLLGNLPGMAYQCRNEPAWPIMFASAGALDLTGYRPEELRGTDSPTYGDLIDPRDRDRVWEEIQEALSAERPFTIEYRLTDARGTSKWVWEKGQAVPDPNGDRHIEGFIIDITERKAYEQALRDRTLLENQVQQLQKADSLGRMAGAIAHHFNNQLQVVLSSLETAMGETLPGSELRDTLADSIQGANRAAEVSRAMLMYLGRESSEREPLDAAALCRAAAPLLEASKPPGVSLQWNLPTAALRTRANRGLIQQALTNLVTNAWEADPSAIIEIRVAETAGGDLPGGHRLPLEWQPGHDRYLTLSVTDRGPGIEEHHIEQIFDPFYTTKFTGRGLGLSTVLGLARSMRGSVTVESRPGVHTTFTLCLPLLESSADAARAPSAPRPPPASRNPGKTVLVVDDDPLLCRLASRLLSLLGLEAVTAPDGPEALEALERHDGRIACVLCDLLMPTMNGWEVLAELRRRHADIPFVLVSGYDEVKTADYAKPESPSYSAFLEKPYEFSRLQSVLERLGISTVAEGANGARTDGSR
jgi:two-component system, cell cycle sensor histidine kinase and response regulator CckA